MIETGHATVAWWARSGDLVLRCLTRTRDSAVSYQIERAGCRPQQITLTAAEFHDLMYAGRHARRPESSVTLLRGEPVPW